MIKYKDTIIFAKPHAAYTFYAGWDNSYQTDRPYLIVHYYEAGELKHETVYIPGLTIEGCVAGYVAKEIVEDADAVQAFAYKQYLEKLQQERYQAELLREKLKPAKYKTVRVIKGRKVPIGTEGRIFWHGNSGYGDSVGLELKDGSKVFTSTSNVLVILDEQGQPVGSEKQEVARAPLKQKYKQNSLKG